MKKVLIVDDDMSIRKLVLASLRKQNVQVLQAMNSTEALAMCRSEHPEVIVMDVVLPGRQPDGLATAECIKRDPETAASRILLISGAVNLDDEQIRHAGADGFLSKPFNPIKLRQKIKLLLGSDPQS